MKKYLSLLLACLSLVFIGCSDKDEPDAATTTAKIRYEATVADPTNFKIQVGYIEENSTTLKQVVVESPFKYQLSAKTGTLIYLSVSPVARVETYVGSTTVKGIVYVDDKLFKEDSNALFSAIGFTFGVN